MQAADTKRPRLEDADGSHVAAAVASSPHHQRRIEAPGSAGETALGSPTGSTSTHGSTSPQRSGPSAWRCDGCSSLNMGGSRECPMCGVRNPAFAAHAPGVSASTDGAGGSGDASAGGYGIGGYPGASVGYGFAAGYGAAGAHGMVGGPAGAAGGGGLAAAAAAYGALAASDPSQLHMSSMFGAAPTWAQDVAAGQVTGSYAPSGVLPASSPYRLPGPGASLKPAGSPASAGNSSVIAGSPGHSPQGDGALEGFGRGGARVGVVGAGISPGRASFGLHASSGAAAAAAGAGAGAGAGLAGAAYGLAAAPGEGAPLTASLSTAFGFRSSTAASIAVAQAAAADSPLRPALAGAVAAAAPAPPAASARKRRRSGVASSAVAGSEASGGGGRARGARSRGKGGSSGDSGAGGSGGGGGRGGDTSGGAGRWTPAEDDALRAGVQACGACNWKRISEEFLHDARSDVQCLHRWQKVLRPGLVKGPWTKEEDETIRVCMEQGISKWSEIASRIPGRIGKQCRERWFNHLAPDVKKGAWTDEEDSLLYHAQAVVGNRWVEIAQQLPGRSENSVKNRWNSAERRKMRERKLHALAAADGRGAGSAGGAGAGAADGGLPMTPQMAKAIEAISLAVAAADDRRARNRGASSRTPRRGSGRGGGAGAAAAVPAAAPGAGYAPGPVAGFDMASTRDAIDV